MRPWPDNEFLRGYCEPLTAECTAPQDRNGTFYRNGPNPQLPPENEHHFFTGDGMIHARTERFKNAIVHVNVKTLAFDTYAFEASYVAEPMFVPRNAAAAEGEGYVLTCVYDISSNTSALCVFDAQNISTGPLGKSKVSHRVSVSCHGTWPPAA